MPSASGCTATPGVPQLPCEQDTLRRGTGPAAPRTTGRHDPRGEVLGSRGSRVWAAFDPLPALVLQNVMTEFVGKHVLDHEAFPRRVAVMLLASHRGRVRGRC